MHPRCALGPWLGAMVLLGACVTADGDGHRAPARAKTPVAAATPGVVSPGTTAGRTAGDAGLPALAARTLPAVVLVVNERKGGRTTYGAGVLVGEAGHVLTNLHVVDHARRLRVMFYRRDRTTYTPTDGGLRRFLFENARALFPARIVKRDDAVDLALLAVDGDTSNNPRLPFATRPVRVGDRVLALGHPGESVWSFTSGVVSALPQGDIQHDAPVSPGCSGGPLLNLAGEVVGINTSKTLSGVEGVAFARPIAMARRLLEATPGGDIDLSDLERAVLGCFHAQELASPSVAECSDPEPDWRLYHRAIDIVARRVGLDEAGRKALRRVLLAGGREAFVRARSREIRSLKGAATEPEVRVHATCGRTLADPRCARPRSLDPIYREVPRSRARSLFEAEADTLVTLEAEEVRYLREKVHVLSDLADPASIRRSQRRGSRIDAVVHRGPDAAWVLVAIRNADGSFHHLTEWWRRRGGVWRQQIPVLDAEVARRPPGWPRPMGREGVHLSVDQVRILMILAARCCVPSEDPAG